MSTLQVLHTVHTMRDFRSSLTGLVSLIPTMGMLHSGHMSLILLAAAQSQSIIVSVYINPTQFATTEERASYPTVLDSDLTALGRIDDELRHKGQGRIKGVFAPADLEMYPYMNSTDIVRGLGTFVTLSPLAARLEGADQPFHFVGVATACLKLFNAVKPHKAYFGEKDFQQTVIVKRLVEDLLVDTKIVVGETVREPDGLAISSRNVFLGNRRRAVAPVLWRALDAGMSTYLDGALGREEVLGKCISETEKEQLAQERLEESDRVTFKVLYFGLSDLRSVEDLEEVDPSKGALLSGAILISPVNGALAVESSRALSGTQPLRLIDSVVLQPREGYMTDLSIRY